jgi:CPA1 family monovalent cation:H+ antiporter
MDLSTSHLTIVALLLLISLLAMLARRTRLPYTVVLVIAGLAVGMSNVLPGVQLTPGLILLVFLPPLIFEAAFHLDFEYVRENGRPIAILAIPAPLISTIMVGGLLHLGVGLHLPSALLFGALISATDPVSVLAMFRELGVPRRLAYIIEGESLFNDGIAIVLYRILLLMILTGEFSLFGNGVRFLVVVLGGGVIGLISGYLFSTVMRRIDDHLIEITLTTVLAYGTYLLADSFRLSGIIAVVVAGVVVGNYGTRIGMSATTRMTVASFWEYVAFIANSFVFLLIGMEINPSLFVGNVYPILWAIVAVLAARALVTYGMCSIGKRLTKRPIPLIWRHVIFWGGLRGSLSVAAALGIPTAIQDRDVILVMTFGVVLFSLVIQGLTLRPLLRLLGMVRAPVERTEYEYNRGKLLSARAALDTLEQMQRKGLASKPIFERLRERYESLSHDLAEEIVTLQEQSDVLSQEELVATHRQCLLVERSTLQDLLRQGMISDEVYRRLISEKNTELQTIE